MLRNRVVDFVEICNVCAKKATIEAAERIINSDKMCRIVIVILILASLFWNTVYNVGRQNKWCQHSRPASPLRLSYGHYISLVFHIRPLFYVINSGGATPGRARSNDQAGRTTTWLMSMTWLELAPPCLLLCFGNSVNRK